VAISLRCVGLRDQSWRPVSASNTIALLALVPVGFRGVFTVTVRALTVRVIGASSAAA